MKMRRLLACIMALLLSASLPVSTLADTYDLANGSVSVNASESGQTVTQENNPDRQDYPDSNPEISSSTATSNTVTITAEENATANVTLSGVNIDTTTSTSTSDTAETKAAITVAGEGNVVIELDGDNTVQSGAGHAGVEKNNSGSLTITDKNDSPGSLEATGGAGGSGIGGGAGAAGSNITISGGTVEATGGENAAGIGGGEGGDGNDIVISGGRVEATGGDAPNKGSGDKIEIGVGGGAGIGGGANGTGSDICVKDDAVVTATGEGNAADIGNGHSVDATEKQENNVNVDDLYTTGSVNGQSGTKEPPKKNENGQSSGGGDYTVQIPNSIFIGQSSDSDSGNKVVALGSPSPSEHVSVRLSNLDSKDLPLALRMKDDELTITVDAENATLTGDRTDIQSLKNQGAEQTVLETNRISVSVSNDFLMKITNADESFQLHTESTGFRLTTTDQNHQKKFDMKLTTDGTQEEQQETQEDTDSPNTDVSKPPKRLTVNIGFSEPPNNDLQKSVLRVMAEMRKATLTSDVDSIQTLIDRGIAQTALTAGGLTIGFENSEVMEKIVATLASGELTIDSENGGVVNKTDANVGNKLDHASVILENNGGQSDNAMDIILYTNGGQSDNAMDIIQGSQTTDCSWMTKYFTDFKLEEG